MPPEGPKVARCVQVIDIGHQYSDFYKTTKPKVVVGWELPTCLATEGDRAGEPMLVWRRFTLSLHENSALRPLLEAWRGRSFTDQELEGFDVQNLLDVPCQVNITHRKDGKKIYADVGSVSKLLDGVEPHERFHDLIYFDIDKPDKQIFESFGNNLKATILKSEEWKARSSGGPDLPTDDPPPPNDDDLLF